MEVEMHCKTKEVHLDNDNEDARSKLCTSLGLKIQSELTDNINVEAYYNRLSRENLFIWKDFLPKTYSANEGDWEKYSFDTIPFSVLEEISFAKSLRVFTDYQIWTPEANIVDPLIVGVIGSAPTNNWMSEMNTYFLISRWGESLKAFNEIRENAVFKLKRNSSRLLDIPDIANRFMDCYILKNMQTWRSFYLSFKGRAWGKSSCCKSKMYKFYDSTKERYIYLCSSCSKVKGI